MNDKHVLYSITNYSLIDEKSYINRTHFQKIVCLTDLSDNQNKLKNFECQTLKTQTD